MYKTFILIIHFAVPTPAHLIRKGDALKTAVKPLGRFYPAFVTDRSISLCLKTDDHAAAILKHLNQHLLTDADRVQIFELSEDHALHGFSQLALWL